MKWLIIVSIFASCSDFNRETSNRNAGLVGNWQFLDSSQSSSPYFEVYINSSEMQLHNRELGSMLLSFEYRILNDSIWTFGNAGDLRPYASYKKAQEDKIILYIEERRLELERIPKGDQSSFDRKNPDKGFQERMENYYLNHDLMSKRELEQNQIKADSQTIEVNINDSVVPIEY